MVKLIAICSLSFTSTQKHYPFHSVEIKEWAMCLVRCLGF